MSGRSRRVLLVTATAGYVHASIPTARRAISEIARGDNDLELGEVLEDVADLPRLTPALLADHDVLCFLSTSGELPLDDAQKRAILDFVAGGKGFVGLHGASATLKEWPEYGDMLGAVFVKHPWTQVGRVIVEDGAHPSTRHLGPSFEIEDEYYTFRDNPRGRVQVLFCADAASLGTEGDLPLAWTKAHGAGRVYYNALGHFDAAWEDKDFRGQVRGGLRWAAGLET